MHKLLPLLPYFRPYRRQLIAGICFILATATMGLISPQIIGGAIDAMREGVTEGRLLHYAGLLLLVTAIGGSFSFLQRYTLVTMSRAIEKDLLRDFHGHLQRLDAGFFHDHTTGDLMARATNDISAVRMLCGPAIMYSTNTVAVGVGAAILMLNIHVGLTLLALVSLPVVAVVTKVFGSKIHKLFQDVQEQFSTVSAKVQESLAGGRVVRAYVQEEAEEREFRELNREYVDRNRDLIRWNAAFHPALQTMVGMGFALVLWFGIRLILAGDITVGQYVTFNLFLSKLVWPMIAIGWVINLAQRSAASMGRLQEIFETEPAIADVPGADGTPPRALPEVAGALRFRDLTFRYPGTADHTPPALENIELHVPAGQTLALVGRTGSGKSTLLQLVPRLFEPPPGHLEVDGVDVHRVRLADLRRAMAVVPQETFLFSTTVAGNIAFARPDADDDAIRRAASLAGLDADLGGFPDGLRTVVGERGITLSGGQKQRVALARAILCDPRILLLDDCLSAVDAQTEELILRNLRQVFPGRTVLLASHRIAAARVCDRIAVIEAGRITAQGTHDELVARPGLYAELYERQRLEDQLAAV